MGSRPLRISFIRRRSAEPSAVSPGLRFSEEYRMRPIQIDDLIVCTMT